MADTRGTPISKVSLLSRRVRFTSTVLTWTLAIDCDTRDQLFLDVRDDLYVNTGVFYFLSDDSWRDVSVQFRQQPTLACV